LKAIDARLIERGMEIISEHVVRDNLPALEKVCREELTAAQNREETNR
jgi:hypothetical protein